MCKVSVYLKSGPGNTWFHKNISYYMRFVLFTKVRRLNIFILDIFHVVGILCSKRNIPRILINNVCVYACDNNVSYVNFGRI